jgi:hypothetical protein
MAAVLTLDRTRVGGESCSLSGSAESPEVPADEGDTAARSGVVSSGMKLLWARHSGGPAAPLPLPTIGYHARLRSPNPVPKTRKSTRPAQIPSLPARPENRELAGVIVALSNGYRTQEPSCRTIMMPPVKRQPHPPGRPKSEQTPSNLPRDASVNERPGQRIGFVVMPLIKNPGRDAVGHNLCAYDRKRCVRLLRYHCLRYGRLRQLLCTPSRCEHQQHD